MTDSATPHTTAPAPGQGAGGDGFRTLFDFLPIGAYRSSPDGRQLRANPALVRLNGYASEEEMLPSVRDIATEWYVEPGRREEFRRLLERDGTVSGFVSEVWRHKTRERIWIVEHAHVVRDAEGRVLYYEGTVEDITEQRRALLALRGNEEHLRQITVHVPGMMYRIHYAADRTYYTFVSDGVRAIYGISPEALLADPLLLRRFRHPEDAAQVDAAIQQAVRDDAPLDLEFRIRTDDGKVKWVQMTSSAVRGENGERWRAGVVLDVTARHQAQQALRERDAAAAAQRATTGFLSRVSHELRTPLNAILGFAQLVHADPSTPAHQRRWVDELLAGGRHLLTLVEDILDLSGAQSGEMRFERADLDLLALARECLPLVADAAARRGVSLVVAEGPLPARGDARRCKQVLINLLTNAVKYNREGGWVEVRPAPEDASPGEVALAVRDGGIGLSEAQQARLFQPFERAGAQHGPAHGSGLGLALSRQLARGMGGDIVVRSEPGAGSSFVLRLPGPGAE